jgi:hypothetical protein
LLLPLKELVRRPQKERPEDEEEEEEEEVVLEEEEEEVLVLVPTLWLHPPPLGSLLALPQNLRPNLEIRIRRGRATHRLLLRCVCVA